MARRHAPGRLATAAVWPFGIALTSWHYLWRTTALHRQERLGTLDGNAPPPIPPGVSSDSLQRVEDGVGPLFHRRYWVRAVNPRLDPEQLIDRLATDPNRAAPTEFARFTKVGGDDGVLRTGDEYLVRMPGPWNGPVRVVDRTPVSFRLATLKGHLEAGQIEFRASEDDGGLVFTIESWARSGDQLSRLLYQNLHMAKEVQLHMWTSFLERSARLSGGRLRGGVHIDTRRVDETGGHARLRIDPDAARALLDGLGDRPVNFELGERAQYTPARGWRVDEYRRSLPPEPPGDPVPGGSWEVARRLLADYEFADPAMVRAAYHRDQPVDGRNMLLEARFFGLRFHLGVRVSGVVDEVREIAGRPVRVWGWNYRTLEGHLERGQMDYEVWKWLDSGQIEFRTCRFVRHAPVDHPLIRLGLLLFGRHEQVKFARRACRRMARLTAAALAGEAADR